MIDVGLSFQTQLFLKSIILGGVVTIAYDALRILRLCLPHSRWLVAMEDILFCGALGVVIFWFALGESFGDLRGFLLLGLFLGYLLCALTISRFLMTCAQRIVDAIYAVGRFFCRLLLAPIYGFILGFSRKMIKFANFSAVFAKKTLKRLKYSLKQRAVVLYNQGRARIRRNNNKGDAEIHGDPQKRKTKKAAARRQ